MGWHLQIYAQSVNWFYTGSYEQRNIQNIMEIGNYRKPVLGT